MTVFYVSSIDATGATITTRHYLPTAVETEKLKRSLAGHSGISVQEGNQACALPWPCVKRATQAPARTRGRG